MSHDRMLELIPLYALDALEGEELHELETHLSDCERCQSELDGYRSVAGSLVADEPAPDHVWQRIVSRIDSSEQSRDADVTPIERETEPPRTQPWVWLAGVAAAIVLVFAGVTISARVFDTGLLAESDIVRAATEAAALPDTVVADFVVDDVPVARIVLTPDGTGFVVPTENLEPLPGSRTYQLWVITPDELVISAGVLGNDPRPSTFTWNGEVAGFALTREVARGVVSSEGDVVSVIEGI